MKYITPEGKEAQGEAAVYLDAVGSVDGDTVKGSALEVPQREIINTIKDAGLTPDEADLHQLSKAVDAKIISKLTVATGTAPGMVKPDGTTTIVNASGVISAVQNPTPVATGSKAGVVKPDGITTTVDVNGTISAVIPEPAVASTSTAGVVKVDGSTISINNGIISAAKEPIATTTVPGLVKPDGVTIIAGSDGTLVATAPAIDIATTSKTGTVKPDGTSITVTGDGTISAKPQTIPVASTTVSGTVKVDGTTVTIAGGVISAAPAVSKATATTLGTVKPDGSTITVDTNGTISAVAQAATMTKATASAIGAVKPDGTTTTVDASGVLTALLPPKATGSTLGIVKPDGVSTVITSDGSIKSVFGGNGGDPNTPPTKINVTTNGTWTPPKNGWVKVSLRAPGGGGCGGSGRVTAAFGGAGGGQGELIEIYQYLNTTDVINIALGTAGNGSNAAISSTETVPTMTPGGDATNATITINGTTTTAIGGKGASSHMNPGIGGGTSATRGESGLNGEKNNISTSYVAAASGGKGGGSDTGYNAYKSDTNTYIQIDATGYGAGGCGGVGFSTAGTAYATRGSNGGPGVCVVEYLAINGNAYKGFSAGKSVAQSIPGNTASYTKLTFDTIDWNPGSVYDPATGKFTPPPGKWSIAASIQVSGLAASSIYQLRLYKNGVVHRTAVQQTAITSNILIVPMSTVIDANGTDYFELYIYSNATAAYSVTVSTGTYFQAVPVQSTSLAATEAMVTAAQAASVSAVAAATSAAHLGAPSNTRYVDISFTGNLNGSTSMTYTALTDGFLNIAVTAGSATDWIRVDYGVSTITENASSIGQLISVYVPVQKDTAMTIYIKGGTITKCRLVYTEGAA